MVIELITAVLVVITAFYAWATFKILRANEKVVDVMREQAAAMTRPYIVVAPLVKLADPIFYLRISNLGKTTATNLRLTLDKSFHMFGESAKDHDLSTFAAFSRPIDSFPPGAEITFSLAQDFMVFDGKTENSNMPHTFAVTAEYEFEGKQVREVNRIDLRPYLGADIPQDAYLGKLTDMNASLKQIATRGTKAGIRRVE